MGRLSEHAAELTAEVGGRKVRDARNRRNVEGFAIARIDQILRAQKMARRW